MTLILRRLLVMTSFVFSESLFRPQARRGQPGGEFSATLELVKERLVVVTPE